VPLAVVTTTLPEAPVATMAVIVVLFTTIKDVAATPPKVIDVAPVKLVPVIVTVVPVPPVDGVNEDTMGVVGTGTTASSFLQDVNATKKDSIKKIDLIRIIG